MPKRNWVWVVLLLSTPACGPAFVIDEAGEERIGVVASAGTTGTHLRVVAANLTSGNRQSYEDAGIRILQGLDPDVVLIQELKSQTATIPQFVSQVFGPEFYFYREPRTGGIPNGIISRWPILASGAWNDVEVNDRDFAWARIDIPGPVDLWAVSVHFKTADGGTRTRQAKRVVSLIQQNVPAGDYVVFGGDLNTSSTNEQAVVELGKLFVTTGARPVDGQGNANTNASRTKPYDRVFANPNLDAKSAPVVLGGFTFGAGLVFDSRRFSNLSAVAPVVKNDSGTSNMQHMAVVRDFELPL